MNSHTAMIRPLTAMLTAMYGTLAVLELVAVVLFHTQAPGYFAPLAVLHGATATASWWWGGGGRLR